MVWRGAAEKVGMNKMFRMTPFTGSEMAVRTVQVKVWCALEPSFFPPRNTRGFHMRLSREDE